jgi:hypothetical protein
VARAYECAVLETNPAHMARRIDDALRALEQRVGSTVRIESTENEAIESTRNALAVLRCEWFEGLSEAMNVVPQKALLKSNLFRNSQGKTELLGTFPDADSARARLPGHLAISSGYCVICDQTGERLFAERAPEGDWEGGMGTTIVIVAVILPPLLVGAFAYFAYLADGANRERQ